jgi:phosphatase NudJ
MAREPIPSWFYSVVVVRRGAQFLIVHECKHGELWYVPAGRVEPGETFADAARRETLEESGVPVRLLGILRLEHSPSPAGSRLRVVFLAEPIDDTAPKSIPDAESLGAAWVSLMELEQYPLRSDEVREMFAYVAAGGTVYPLGILQSEGIAYREPD